jgi:hypothetical protein
MYQQKIYFIKIYQGTTLLELLLTLMFSLLLLGLLLDIYLGTERQNELRSTLLSLQDNANFALQSLSAELQETGFWGCPRLSAEFSLRNTGALNPIKNLELQQDASITIRHRSAVVLSVREIEKTFLVLSSEFRCEPGDILVISDCKHAEWFEVAEVSFHGAEQKLIPVLPLQASYSEQAEIGYLESNTYFVGKTARKDELGHWIFALYKRDLKGRRKELVEGIEKMKLRFFQLESKASIQGVSIELALRQKNLRKTVYAFVALRP